MKTLAFALASIGGEPRVLGVTETLAQSVRAFVIKIDGQSFTNIFSLIRQHPREKIAATFGSSESKIYTELLAPLAGTGSHLCAGLNYRSHQDETAAGDILLFEKSSAPTPFRSELRVSPEWLLDYEVEIGLAFDRDLKTPADIESAQALVFLSNDLSDRATQIRMFQAGTARGFKEAKSFAGFLPLGSVALWPESPLEFIKDLKIELTVNGQLRQSAEGRQMVLDPKALLEKAFRESTLLDDGVFRAERILLTGTPGGVVLKAPTLGAKLKAVGQSLLRMKLNGEAIRDAIVDNLQRQKTFLQAGDEVAWSLSAGGGAGYLKLRP